MQYNFRGIYDSTQSYAVSDVVSYIISGTTRYYYCLSPNSSTSPQQPTTIDSTYWAILNTLSNFPNSVDSFIYRASIQGQDKADIDRINQLTLQTSLTSAEQTELSNLISKQRNKLFLADDLNAIQDSLSNLQIFFKDKIVPYLGGMDAGALRNDIGDLTTLTTADKTSLVNAVNENNQTISNHLLDYAHQYSSDTGTANAYAVSLNPAPTVYTTGMMISFMASNANTGVSTININSLGIKTIKKNISSDLAGGDIKAGQVILLVYDGTNFQFASSSMPVVATSSTVGTVKIGQGVSVQSDGTISVKIFQHPNYWIG